MKDRITEIYKAVDEMIACHGKPRPERFGGGTWDVFEEITNWKAQIITGESQNDFHLKPLTPLQWEIIDSYITIKIKEKFMKKGF